MSNRLNLDFSLDTSEERKIFIQNYLQLPMFQKTPLSAEEIEMCANYILWGKDIDGQNGVQKKEYQIQTKRNTWNKPDLESLDALMETPTFNEALIIKPSQAIQKIPRTVFSRENALKNAPETLQSIFLSLFKEIDETELIINFYELAHNKRKNPPRDELLSRLTSEEIEHCRNITSHLNQYRYLKMRHQLVDLRKQQFSLKDSYTSLIQVDTMMKVPEYSDKPLFGADMMVYPMGLKSQESINKLTFIELDNISPKHFSKDQIAAIIKFYWENQDKKEKFYFDFENMEHVYHLILLLGDIDTAPEVLEFGDTIHNLIETLNYYIDNCDFNDIYKEILTMKINHSKNSDIAQYINQKYDKNYTVNYISTIFRQKIIKKINETATYHKELILELPFEEDFKTCSCCGRTYLKTTRNFMKKKRSSDGFTGKCKNCERQSRNKERIQ